MLNDNFRYFTANMPKLYKKYGHRFLAIKNKKIIGDYNNFENALQKTIKTEKLGTFLIQECFDNPDKGVYYFQNNVSF